MYAICEFMPYEIHITGNTLLQIVLCGYPILYKKRNGIMVNAETLAGG